LSQYTRFNMPFIFQHLICQFPVGCLLPMHILSINATRLLSSTNQRLSSTYFGVTILRCFSKLCGCNIDFHEQPARF